MTSLFIDIVIPLMSAYCLKMPTADTAVSLPENTIITVNRKGYIDDEVVGLLVPLGLGQIQPFPQSLNIGRQGFQGY